MKLAGLVSLSPLHCLSAYLGGGGAGVGGEREREREREGKRRGGRKRLTDRQAGRQSDRQRTRERGFLLISLCNFVILSFTITFKHWCRYTY